ncbi:MAG TPA: hypothetical protein VLJ58_17735 [Ramlibacter sp.]|nr:hypothetical protein [Ramlibacter sp.]
MQNRRPSRPRGNRTATSRGNTLPVQGDRQQPAPRLPHERDESADSQPSGEPSAQRVGCIAHRDVEQGLQDTDKGPVMDAAYERLRKAGKPGR